MATEEGNTPDRFELFLTDAIATRRNLSIRAVALVNVKGLEV